MIAEGKSGEVRTPTSTVRELRYGPYNDLIVNDIGLGRYFEATRLGRAFVASTVAAGTALVAANLSPLAAGTGQPLVGILNSQASGKAAVILNATVSFTPNGVPTTMPIPVWNFIPNPSGVTSGGSGFSSLSGRLDSTPGVMKVFLNAALTGGVVATMLRPFLANASLNFGSSTQAANSSVVTYSEETAGSIIVPPGAFLGIAVSLAVTTINATAAMTWAEIDWPLA